MEISNQTEEDVVRDYCCNRQLIAPETNIISLIVLILLLELMSIIAALATYYVLNWFDISFSFEILHLLVSVTVFCIYLKKICIVAVEVYQHYASEEIRRRCTLMPSCSEYALLTLKKDNVFKALYKIHIRLTKRCKGSYKIDYP